jgi:hypothetical protein
MIVALTDFMQEFKATESNIVEDDTKGSTSHKCGENFEFKICREWTVLGMSGHLNASLSISFLGLRMATDQDMLDLILNEMVDENPMIPTNRHYAIFFTCKCVLASGCSF